MKYNLVPLAIAFSLCPTWTAAVASSCDGLASKTCRDAEGCEWSAGSCVVETHISCSERSSGSCETGDGHCMKVRGQCLDVNGDGQEFDSCMASLTADSDGDLIYAEVSGSGCAAGLVCNVANASNADAVDTNIQGFCEAQECLGKKVPGNCNGNNPNDPDCVSATERVTICHRTCSAKNPWVRITIDEDAWDGEGCGHMLQHDIRDECSSKAPWTEWGVNRKDYLIKRHGTRDDVAANRTKSQVKAYWKKWERACPYVRNGACCDWNDPENPCCGEEDPQPLNPEIKIAKYAGPPDSCSVNGVSGLEYNMYTMSSTSDSWAYCYEISVPEASDECLFNTRMKDPATAGGTSNGDFIDVFNSTGGNHLCPGTVVYIPGPTLAATSAPEGPDDAMVTGTGELSNREVTDSDPAGVNIVTAAPTTGPTAGPSPGPTDGPTTAEAAPEPKCVPDMPDPGSEYCPGDSGVVPLRVQGAESLPSDADIVWGITEVPGAESVQFQVQNPFATSTALYVQYQKPTGNGGGYEFCDEYSLTECGSTTTETITADCLYAEGEPFTVVQLYFVDTTDSFEGIFGPVTVEQCCHAGDIPSTSVAQYSVMIRCSCPTDGRRLRHSKKSLTADDVSQMVSEFQFQK